MSVAGFDTPAQMPTEAGIPTDIIKHEMIGDEEAAEQIVEANPVTTMEVNENGDSRDGLDFLYEKDSSDEDEAVVTIGDIRKHLPFQKQSMAGKDKIDMDGQPTINGTMIYDLDLATMEDKPWQKPGADITDYFNYGFNEETWNSYCERQRKLRAEYGTQKDVNRVIVSSININFNPQQAQQQTQSNINYQSGRQLINVVGPEIPQKASKMTFDFTKPPPSIVTPANSTFPASEVNTSVASINDEDSPSPTPSTIPVFDFSKPPPNFNPSVPPPTIPAVNLSAQPQTFNQPTPRYAFAGFNNQQSQQGQQFRTGGGPPGLSEFPTSFEKHDSREKTHGESSENNSEDEYSRRKRRRRSRSGSPRRRKEDKSRDYRDSKSSSSRGSKRRDDRDKRRDHDDYEKDRKRRKYERSERGERKPRYERNESPDAEAPPGFE